MVTLGGAMKVRELLVSWRQPLTRLSCEIEGHPLGGGMLKLEPREAGQVVLRRQDPDPPGDRAVIREGIATMRKWRHCG